MGNQRTDKTKLQNLAQYIKLRYRRWFFLMALVINVSLAISYIGLWVIQMQRGNLWRADFRAL